MVKSAHLSASLRFSWPRMAPGFFAYAAFSTFGSWLDSSFFTIAVIASGATTTPTPHDSSNAFGSTVALAVRYLTAASTCAEVTTRLLTMAAAAWSRLFLTFVQTVYRPTFTLRSASAPTLCAAKNWSRSCARSGFVARSFEFLSSRPQISRSGTANCSAGGAAEAMVLWCFVVTLLVLAQRSVVCTPTPIAAEDPHTGSTLVYEEATLGGASQMDAPSPRRRR
jgi:hypothetical protein